MNDYVIITDSSCDLPQDMADALELKVIPLMFTIKGQEYSNYLDGREMSAKEFYRLVRSGESATTSAININTYNEILEPILQDGKDVLVIAFSSGLSNTCNASMLAVRELAEKYPDRKVYSVDSLGACMGEGLLVYNAVMMKKQGSSIDEVRDWVENNRLRLCHWFTVDDLNHLKRGGRVSAATALLGTMLGIKPVLHVDNEGHLINMSKVRGRQASLNALVDRMAETVEKPEEQMVFISHGDCEEDAQKVAALVRKRMKVKDIVINYIGPVIGAHSGPGTIALFFLGSHR